MKALSIFEQLCFSTARIEAIDEIGNTHCGTGFFFDLKVDDNLCPLIITNKHMVENMISMRFMLTKADNDGNPCYTEHVPIVIPPVLMKLWIFHPDANVDLCVFPINVLLNEKRAKGNNLFYRAFDNELIPKIDSYDSFDAVESIIMTGYPIGIWDDVNNMPITRRGITATPFNIDYQGKKEFMIDAACFPGSSGSPVFICDVGSYRNKKGGIHIGGSRLFLLGVLYAGPQLQITGEMEIINIPTMQNKLSPVSRIPTNLGCVIKSERIIEFVSIIKGISIK